MQKFHLTATGYNLNYLPEYIALRHGFFREQDLEVEVNIPIPWDGVLDDLAGGRAAMALGGAWVPSMYLGRVQSYTILGQIANRCPLAILRRSDAASKDFDVSGMAGRTVLLKSIGGAAAGFFTKMLLREHGVDPSKVDYIQDLDGCMLGKLFEGGMGDFFVTDNLSARIMAARNPNVTIAMECVTQGEIPWSVYYSERNRLTPEASRLQKSFFLGLRKGIEWVLAHDAGDFQDELAELFPNAPIDVVVALTNSFRRQGMWRSIVIPPMAFQRWQRGLSDVRLIDRPIDYGVLVNTEAAEAAQKQSSPSNSLYMTSGKVIRQ
ncbi:periplasmic binding protein-like II [Teratosphaeria destructans]|uniref:4-amino-5-hydroxymethyl-2-methylpyrimidine phosphate synthase n=1 Tax=Teratosphaeria destructans TaxID=418781 RepID=A0A9W7SNQ7_9PEZI|nr:periplasmic binding protein-like II [Teratosphaeria destructans]